MHTGAVEWQETVLAWIVNNGGHPVIVVKYEDMKTKHLNGTPENAGLFAISVQ